MLKKIFLKRFVYVLLFSCGNVCFIKTVVNPIISTTYPLEYFFRRLSCSSLIYYTTVNLMNTAYFR